MTRIFSDRVKILATIGPACADPDILCAMLEEGAEMGRPSR